MSYFHIRQDDTVEHCYNIFGYGVFAQLRNPACNCRGNAPAFRADTGLDRHVHETCLSQAGNIDWQYGNGGAAEGGAPRLGRLFPSPAGVLWRAALAGATATIRAAAFCPTDAGG